MRTFWDWVKATEVNQLCELAKPKSITLFNRYVDVATKRLVALNKVPDRLNESNTVHERTKHYFANTPENQPFYAWARSHGVQLRPDPPYKEGGEGCAYFVGNAKVIKFIINDEDAEMVALVIHSQLQRETTMQEIVGIGPYFAIMQEEVETTNFPTGIVNAGYLVKLYIKEVQDMVTAANARHLLSPDELERHVNANVAAFPEGQMAWYKSQMQKMQPYLAVLLRAVFRILDKTGRLWLDMHHANFGYTQEGEVKLFDLGLSALIWQEEVPEIRRIQG